MVNADHIKKQNKIKQNKTKQTKKKKKPNTKTNKQPPPQTNKQTKKKNTSKKKKKKKKKRTGESPYIGSKLNVLANALGSTNLSEKIALAATNVDLLWSLTLLLMPTRTQGEGGGGAAAEKGARPNCWRLQATFPNGAMRQRPTAFGGYDSKYRLDLDLIPAQNWTVER